MLLFKYNDRKFLYKIIQEGRQSVSINVNHNMLQRFPNNYLSKYFLTCHIMHHLCLVNTRWKMLPHFYHSSFDSYVKFLKSVDQKSRQRLGRQIWSIFLREQLSVSPLTSLPHPYGYKVHLYGGILNRGWGRGGFFVPLTGKSTIKRCNSTEKSERKRRDDGVGWQ